jgi:hypothetical protein
MGHWAYAVAIRRMIPVADGNIVADDNKCRQHHYGGSDATAGKAR